MSWTSLNDLHQQVLKLWNSGLLLASIIDGEPFFPRRLVFKTPTSRELSERYDEVRQWIARLQQAQPLRIEMKPVRHRILGENRVPAQAWLDSFEDAISLIGKHKEVRTFSDMISLTQNRNPVLIPWLQANPVKALSLAGIWSKLLDIIDWLKAHPRPAIYLRQVDIPGVDSKFIERHRGILIALLDLCLPENSIDITARGASRFEARYGFLQKPARLRFRVLDPDIRLIAGPSQDISLTQESFCVLDTEERFNGIRKIFITENEINFLTFPEIKQGLVLFGSGYGFDSLSNVAWLARLQVYYWGDIDSHGFAILDQLRAKLPHAQSLLMDESTLLAHQDFWEQEDKPEYRELNRLTPAELELYHDLHNNRYGHKLRLEQERIGFNYLLARLEGIE